MDIINQLEDFIEKTKTSRINNTYISDDKVTAYVRITSRYIAGEMLQTIDVGNVSVDEEYQNQGVFKNFLEGVEILAKRSNRVVYIESVLSEILLAKLPKYGYTSNQETCPSFHKHFH